MNNETLEDVTADAHPGCVVSAASTIPAPADHEVEAFDCLIEDLRKTAALPAPNDWRRDDLYWCHTCHDTRSVRVECDECGGRGTIGTADCDECAGRGCVADECPDCAGEQSEDVPELDERELELKITEDREERR